MAGTIAKSFGLLLLVPGIVVAVAGLAAAVVGALAFDGALEDPRPETAGDRAQLGAYLVVFGLAGTALAALAITVGAILLTVGRSLERRALTDRETGSRADAA